MKTPTTHLGNKQLHKRHSVMIEADGAIQRAKVMDQIMIDRYLMDSLIDIRQHAAGEFLLRQATNAGVWAKGINWNASGGDRGRPNYVPFGAFPLGRTLWKVKCRYGSFHCEVLTKVVLHNHDVSADERLLTCLREGLNWIGVSRMNYKQNPITRLKAAAARKAAALTS